MLALRVALPGKRCSRRRSAEGEGNPRPLVLSPPPIARAYRSDRDPACWIAAHTRCGVAGMSNASTPNGTSASTTAFITAGVEAMEPDSPAPLAPSEFTGEGVTV